jgi:twitching motility protein PilT
VSPSVAQLDPFIKLAFDRRADHLELGTGAPVTITVGTTSQTVSRAALTEPQLLALLREIAPAGMAADVLPGATVRFTYGSPSGPVEVAIQPGTGGLTALLRPVDAGAAAAAATGTTNGAAGESANDERARAALDVLLRQLIESGSSDLHLRSGEPPIYRQHGELARDDSQPIPGEALRAMLLSIMPAPIRAEWTETGDADWAYEIEGCARFRCNAGQDRHGPFAVFRAIPSQVPTADDLGLSREIQNLCYLTKGLVVVTGPTGSGKSTTLAAMVDLVNRTRTDHILTIEDPIEFVHPSKSCLITQRQIGVHTRGFKQALRAALREDPDVVLVGEMRDLETVSIAIETAETGHLVFGTLHTTTAASTIDRIIDQFPPDRQAQVRVMLSESLRGVISQTLCKKVGGGRIAAREVLLTLPAISNLIREGKTFQIPSIMQTNRKAGMVTLNDALIDLVDNGLVEPKEAYMKAVEKAGFAAALKAKRHDTSFLGEAAV